MTVASADVIDLLAGLAGTASLDAVRNRRAQAREHAQRSFEALLEPEQTRGFELGERYAVAAFVAGLHGFEPATAFYLDLLADEASDLLGAVRDATTAARTTGPYGAYREEGLRGESTDGLRFVVPADAAAALGDRLAAAFAHAHLLVFRPRESSSDALRALVAAGWDADQIVSLSQLVAFLAFQVRSAWSLRVIAGEIPDAWTSADAAGSPDAASLASAAGAAAPATPLVSDHPGIERPEAFTQEGLGWVPWLEPIAKADLTPEQHDALIQPVRADMPYFRLLARDPDALKARTLTDLDIFFNTDGGLPRAERELAAAATSRLNGCVFCASVHAAAATRESGRRDDVERLLEEGVDADLGDERWNAVTAASVALASTPPTFGAAEVERLRAAGLDEASVVDAANGAAFFHWANRLMLSLGEPEVPARRAGRGAASATL